MSRPNDSSYPNLESAVNTIADILKEMRGSNLSCNAELFNLIVTWASKLSDIIYT